MQSSTTSEYGSIPQRLGFKNDFQIYAQASFNKNRKLFAKDNKTKDLGFLNPLDLD